MMNSHMQTFLQEKLGEQPLDLTRVAGDASFRSYHRVKSQQGSFILMDAPPDQEDSSPFVDIAGFLKHHGVAVPQILHAQLDQGYLLIEDFGDLTFLKAIEATENRDHPNRENNHIHHLYQKAIATLLQIQATPMDGSSIAHQRFFDRAMLRRELALLTDWYIAKIENKVISDQDQQQFESVFTVLIDDLLQQPQLFVHRDYHSRNLMWHQDRVGVLDFQDAVIGPITYDLASLLRDCYVAWDQPFREKMMKIWLQGAKTQLGYIPENWQTFQKAFDWMAIQRNLKAVGIFARLSCRDGKHGYLHDIPRTMEYVYETVKNYPELQPLGRLLDRYVTQP